MANWTPVSGKIEGFFEHTDGEMISGIVLEQKQGTYGPFWTLSVRGKSPEATIVAEGEAPRKDVRQGAIVGVSGSAYRVLGRLIGAPVKLVAGPLVDVGRADPFKSADVYTWRGGEWVKVSGRLAGFVAPHPGLTVEGRVIRQERGRNAPYWVLRTEMGCPVRGFETGEVWQVAPGEFIGVQGMALSPLASLMGARVQLVYGEPMDTGKKSPFQPVNISVDDDAGREAVIAPAGDDAPADTDEDLPF